MTNTETRPSLDHLESEIAQAPADRESWGVPEYVTVASIRVRSDRLPVDEDVVEAIVATIRAGNVNALPPIHVWRKQTGSADFGRRPQTADRGIKKAAKVDCDAGSTPWRSTHP